MKVYLDVSCLNRPFDDQSQDRVRLESEAVTLILEKVDSAAWEQVSSEMALIEIDANPDVERKARVRLLLPESSGILKLTAVVWDRAAQIEKMGFKSADATHVAAAEVAGAAVFLSCDDRLCRLAARSQADLRVRVANPLDWLKEVDNADDS